MNVGPPATESKDQGGIMPVVLRERVRLTMHLPEGYSKVLLESTGFTWDIKTELIPFHLRTIGSRFVVVAVYSLPITEGQEVTAQQMRKSWSVSVEKITDEH